LETIMDGALVCGPRIFEPKQHCRVAVGVKRRDEGRLDLVTPVETDLVITRVESRKDNSSQPAIKSMTSSIGGKPKGSLGQCLLRSV
jgi:hypothetical protein